MPFSAELTTLCQAQMEMLGQFHVSVKGVVYFSQAGDRDDAPGLYPVAVYPPFQPVKALQGAAYVEGGLQYRTESDITIEDLPEADPVIPERDNAEKVLPVFWGDMAGVGSQTPPGEMVYQVVLPLQRERFVLGALVVSRADRDWLDGEYCSLEQVAETLTLAGLMDQRMQWLQQQLKQRDIQLLDLHHTVDNLIHQIRNPITALKTFGKLLLRRFTPQDRNRSVADNIVRESDRLSLLVQQLSDQLHAQLPSTAESVTSTLALPPEQRHTSTVVVSDAAEVSRSPAGLLPSLSPAVPELSEIFLADLLRPLTEAATAIAEERSLDFIYHAPQDKDPASIPPIVGQGSPLREALSNLVDNALKYTPAWGTVQVWWEPSPPEYPGWQWVVISDTGPGIPETDLPFLFQRHYRGVQSQGDIPGTGLGLALARDWIEQMGGRLEVISPAGIWRPMAVEGGPGVAFRLWLAEVA